MAQQPLMPKAIAIWLIENTSLTFKQIAQFCQIHVLEVETLANEESHKSLKPINPVATGETTWEEIHKCEAQEDLGLPYFESKEYIKYSKVIKKDVKQSKFKRKNKPEGILWVLQHYPNVNDYQLSKLLSTTSNMIKSIRSKSYWNYKNLTPKNPVTLELCKEEELSKVIALSSEKEKAPEK